MVGRSRCTRAVLLVAAALATAACTVGPDYEKPAAEVPDNWGEHTVTAAAAAATEARLKEWWTGFDDPTLSGLIALAIADNYSLQIARQRLVEARAERDIVRAADYPQVEALAQGSTSRSSTTLDYPPGIGPYHSYVFGLDASYEVDVFGGTRRAEEAATATVGAAVEDRRSILVSLISEIAGDYALLRTAQRRLLIARQTVDLAQQVVDLTTTQFDRGLTTSLAVAEATAQLETVRAGLPPLTAEGARLTHTIAVLAGRLPTSLEAQLTRSGPPIPVPPTLPLTLPSEVVVNRPDIRRAERRLAASTAKVGEAIASLYPHFTIPLLLTPSTSALSEAFSAASLVWNIGLSVKQDLYTGGRDQAASTRRRRQRRPTCWPTGRRC